MTIQLSSPSIDEFDPTESINEWLSSAHRVRRPNYNEDFSGHVPHFVEESDLEASDKDSLISSDVSDYESDKCQLEEAISDL